jgi:hypothetical protein
MTTRALIIILFLWLALQTILNVLVCWRLRNF